MKTQQHQAVTNYLARHPGADAKAVTVAYRDLAVYLSRRLPHVDVNQLLSHNTRADSATVRTVLASLGRSQTEIELAVAA